MSKKQLILVSTIAAVPGALLLVLLVMGLLQGMLSDTARVSVVLWIVWVLAVLGSGSAAFLPFAIMFFPGLMPEPAPAGIAAADESGPVRTAGRKTGPVQDADEDFEEESEDDSAADGDDDGEQLFEDDALDDDFDDDFGNTFGDDKK